MMKKVFIILLWWVMPFTTFSQTVTYAKVLGTDTIPHVCLKPCNVVTNRSFKSRIAEKRYNKLKRDVLKVYPYAKLAGELLHKYEQELQGIHSETMRKVYMKKVENELKEQFGDELMKLTINQGRILIALIDRETGETSYELVEELRGKFSAFFWQGLARIFGHNLKTHYDPYGEQKDIENIVQQIELGILVADNKTR